MQQRFNLKTALPALAALALLAGQPALAEPAAAPPAEQPNCPWKGHDKRGAGIEKNLEALRPALQLAPAQEPAWAEWTAKLKAGRPDWQERRQAFEEEAKLPAVERMEKQLAHMKEGLAKWEGLLAATKTFYAVLSPEQKQVFDQQWKPRHPGPHGGPR